jgi:putative ABC transport system permease protein
VAAQIAVTLCLYIGAGLLLRSFARLLDVDAGFDAKQAVLAQVSLAGSRYEPERWSAYVKRGVEELRTLPGVTAVGGGAPLPLAGQPGLLRFGVRIAGRPAPADGRSDRAYLRWATPGYFEAMGIPLAAGRAFENRDDPRGTPVAIVDQIFVQRYLPGEEPIGRRLQMTNERAPRQIVGVVGAIRQTSLEDAADPHVYIPQAQNPSPIMTFVVRTSADPAALIGPVRERLRTIDPSRPVYNVRTAADLVAGTLSVRRFHALLITLFALLAGVLTVVGMYGLMAGWVAESRKEFGVRLALGAERREVISLVVGRALRITAVGIAIGLPLAVASTKVMQTMLFGVGARDAATIGGACALLLAVGVAGAYLPARRAVAVNPVDSLRGDF